MFYNDNICSKNIFSKVYDNICRTLPLISGKRFESSLPGWVLQFTALGGGGGGELAQRVKMLATKPDKFHSDPGVLTVEEETDSCKLDPVLFKWKSLLIIEHQFVF